MTTNPNLLTRGNGKLGESIHSWSIPAVETCPGRTTLCERVCYARSGRFRTTLMDDRLQVNLDASLQNNFERRMIAEIRRRGVHVLRIHVSGDMYSSEYAMKWVRIARRCPRTSFYGYTRSYRIPEILPVLVELSRQKNVTLWWSVDAETGIPTTVPPNVHLAYLQTTAEDDPGPSDIVFRTRPLRGTPITRIGLSVVCPTENGTHQAENTTCTSCRRCFR